MSEASGTDCLAPRERAGLIRVLGQSRDFGFLGPGGLDAQIAHSLAFVALCERDPGGVAVDLGSGGGLPGLVLAFVASDRSWVLLDANQRRTSFLTDAIRRLELSDRVRVVCERAEAAGRSSLRGIAGLVVARGFGGPAPTAECAAPLLRPGGALIVAEPPGAPPRWPADGLAPLGLRADGGTVEPVALRRFRQVQACAGRYPRRTGLPTKRPLF